MKFYKEAFKLIRESRGFTFEEIGKRLNVSKQAVSGWENPKKDDKPRPKRVYLLAKMLGCSAVDISDLKPEQEVIQMTGDGHNVNGNNNDVGDKTIGAQIKGKKQKITVLDNTLDEKVIRKDERRMERKKLQDYIMALDKIDPAIRLEIYNHLNKED